MKLPTKYISVGIGVLDNPDNDKYTLITWVERLYFAFILLSDPNSRLPWSAKWRVKHFLSWKFKTISFWRNYSHNNSKIHKLHNPYKIEFASLISIVASDSYWGQWRYLLNWPDKSFDQNFGAQNLLHEFFSCSDALHYFFNKNID